jgi:hypothetical protein
LGILTWIARDEPDRPVDGLRRHPHLSALVTYHAQVFHLAVVAFVIGADALGGSALLMWIPAAAITAVYWTTLREVEVEVEAAGSGHRGSGDAEHLLDRGREQLTVR